MSIHFKYMHTLSTLKSDRLLWISYSETNWRCSVFCVRMAFCFFLHFQIVNIYCISYEYVNTYARIQQLIWYTFSLFKLNTNLSNNKHDSHGLQLKINYKIWIEMVNRTLLLSNNFIGKWTHNNRFSNGITRKISSMSNNKSKILWIETH